MSPLLTPASSATSCIVSALAPEDTMQRTAARRIRSAASTRGRRSDAAAVLMVLQPGTVRERTSRYGYSNLYPLATGAAA